MSLSYSYSLKFQSSFLVNIVSPLSLIPNSIICNKTSVKLPNIIVSSLKQRRNSIFFIGCLKILSKTMYLKHLECNICPLLLSIPKNCKFLHLLTKFLKSYFLLNHSTAITSFDFSRVINCHIIFLARTL